MVQYLFLVLAQLDRRVLRGLVLAARVGVAAAALAVALAAGRNEAVREAELVWCVSVGRVDG